MPISDEVDDRELAMRDACAKLAQGWRGGGPLTDELAAAIERLPVGAGEAANGFVGGETTPAPTADTKGGGK